MTHIQINRPARAALASRNTVATPGDVSRLLADQQRNMRTTGKLPVARAAASIVKVTPADVVAAEREQGHARGWGIGAVAERRRIAAILGAPEAVGREQAAKQLAFQTDHTVDRCRAVLAGMPTDEALQATAFAKRVAARAPRRYKSEPTSA